LYVYDGAAWVEASQSFRTGDLDAWNYIYRVQNADGQDLEEGVIAAVLKFVAGCKTDGIWDAIQSSCVMAGARTLAGALIPLKGSDPTNVNFTPADYNRKTGLVGDGATKYLNSNRNNNADPQNSKHLAAYIQDNPTSQANAFGIIAVSNTTGASGLLHNSIAKIARINGTTISPTNTSDTSVGFIGASRSNSANFDFRFGGLNRIYTSVSETPLNRNLAVFAHATSTSATLHTTARIAFFSIGEAIDLSKLDSRVSTLMTDFNIAIP
jgi:hypothetical protein